jgi:recombinational DNA repair protein (RecF pathway)
MIHHRKYREKSHIVHLFTQEYGRVDGILRHHISMEDFIAHHKKNLFLRFFFFFIILIITIRNNYMIHHRKYREKSHIVHLFTQEYGRVDGILRQTPKKTG